MRDALRAALEIEDGIRVACEAGDMLAALRFAAGTPITVAIVDSLLAGLQSPLGLDALRALARRVAVVVMGTGDPALYAASYVAAGASGYWAKDGDLTALVGLLRDAVDRRPAALASSINVRRELRSRMPSAAAPAALRLAAEVERLRRGPRRSSVAAPRRDGSRPSRA